MKKFIPLLVITGMLLIPLLVRFSFPSLYLPIRQQYPILGAALLIALDIVWLWLALFTVMLVGGLINRLRARLQLKDTLRVNGRLTPSRRIP